MSEIIKEIRQRLFALQDMQYRDFQSRLMPTVAKETVIGVRMPELRRLAKELSAREDIKEFLEDLPHGYYEENNLHGFLIMQERDYTRCIEKLEIFLPCIDNWATCDLLRPKIFQKNLQELIQKIPGWLGSEHPYIIRFGIEMLMVYYLDEAFSPEYPEWVAGLSQKKSSQSVTVNLLFEHANHVVPDRGESPQRTFFTSALGEPDGFPANLVPLRENLSANGPRRTFSAIRDGRFVNNTPDDRRYYVNMMIAWYFATALAKQYETTLPYIENHVLDTWTHNKTIQKAIESDRISEEHKAYLRTLRVRRALP
ncbi:MAG: DNA alkylation repair protein [Clostridiales bacterium]|nr:DNA alkylation repair protein [Clostridiales bacterium]